MAEYTDRFNLIRLTSNDLSPDSYKFSDADRVLIDTLLYLGAEGHHHTGGAGANDAPDSAPNLTLDTSSGSIPAGRRVYYKYTYVDGSGIETGASPESFIDTPGEVSAPAAPTLETATTGGTLQPGNYFYVLTAYDTFDNLETTADNPAYISVPYTTTTNTITLTLPILPSGATGFNIYRKGPSNIGYRYLESIDMNQATPPTEFEDDGGYTEDPDRPLPTANTTVSLNSIEVALPGATPALPGIGYSWRIYRTYTASDYTNSLLTTTTSLTYTDTGTATTIGEPPGSGTSVGNPAKIQLTDAAEVQGQLPVANIENFAEEVQDALGLVFDDTSSVNVTYNDSTGHFTFDVLTIAATQVSYSGNARLASTNVETALDEVDNEKLDRSGGEGHALFHAGNSGTSHTINLANANVYRLILTDNCTLTFPTVTGAGAGATPTTFAHRFSLILVQDGTGSRTITWPASVKWPGASAPTLTTTVGAVDYFEFITIDAGSTWYQVGRFLDLR